MANRSPAGTQFLGNFLLERMMAVAPLPIQYAIPDFLIDAVGQRLAVLVFGHRAHSAEIPVSGRMSGDFLAE